jgi:hypothetical protein
VALSFGALTGLDQEQEPERAGSEAGSRDRLGTVSLGHFPFCAPEMDSKTFRDQHALLQYVEEHDLAYAWEGMSSFSHRLRTLAPGQYELVEVQTKRGITRALVFPKAILEAEREADAPLREALAIKRERLRARREERKKRS